ncbi:MAG TPA: phosphotransferase [Solirubrobacterales bacterium]
MKEENWVSAYLRARGLAEPYDAVDVRPLEGGVSGEIFDVRVGSQAFVVKRARARLDVEQDWFADLGRVVVEAEALEAAHALTPNAVPRVVDLDQETATMVIERSDPTWTDWRSSLLAGRAGDHVAARLGEVLGIWHRETAADPGLLETFASQEIFEELRLAPFHEAVAAAHPDLGGRVSEAADRLRGERLCLVHGDFSPKNVLHGKGGIWVLDWEVAHVGAPIFDLAFMLAHLTLKAVHRPADAPLYEALATTFVERYARAGGPASVDDPGLQLQIGSLLLARVDGKSPASYLSPKERDAVRALAIELIGDRNRSDHLSYLWEVS